jgi:hypothetical protein
VIVKAYVSTPKHYRYQLAELEQRSGQVSRFFPAAAGEDAGQ